MNRISGRHYLEVCSGVIENNGNCVRFCCHLFHWCCQEIETPTAQAPRDALISRRWAILIQRKC